MLTLDWAFPTATFLARYYPPKSATRHPLFVNFLCAEICTNCWHIGILKGSHSGCRFRASQLKDLLSLSVCHPSEASASGGSAFRATTTSPLSFAGFAIAT